MDLDSMGIGSSNEMLTLKGSEVGKDKVTRNGQISNNPGEKDDPFLHDKHGTSIEGMDEEDKVDLDLEDTNLEGGVKGMDEDKPVAGQGEDDKEDDKEDPSLEETEQLGSVEDPNLELEQLGSFEDPGLEMEQLGSVEDPNLETDQLDSVEDPNLETDQLDSVEDPNLETDQLDSVEDPNLELDSVEDPNLETDSVEDPNLETDQLDSVEDPNLELDSVEDPNLETDQLDSVEDSGLETEQLGSVEDLGLETEPLGSVEDDDPFVDESDNGDEGKVNNNFEGLEEGGLGNEELEVENIDLDSMGVGSNNEILILEGGEISEKEISKEVTTNGDVSDDSKEKDDPLNDKDGASIGLEEIDEDKQGTSIGLEEIDEEDKQGTSVGLEEIDKEDKQGTSIGLEEIDEEDKHGTSIGLEEIEDEDKMEMDSEIEEDTTLKKREKGMEDKPATGKGEDDKEDDKEDPSLENDQLDSSVEDGDLFLSENDRGGEEKVGSRGLGNGEAEEMDLAGLQEKGKVNGNFKSSEGKVNEKEVISLSDEDENEGVGQIRIRDFGSLLEPDSDDDGDDIVEIPKKHTKFAPIESVSKELVSLALQCDDETDYLPNSFDRDNAVYRKARFKILGIKRNMRAGISTISNNNFAPGITKGMTITNNNPLPISIMTTDGRSLPLVSYRQVQTTAARPFTVSSGMRLTTVASPMPATLGRPRMAVQQTPVTMMSQLVRPAVGGTTATLPQLIFDPSTGYLLCPSPINPNASVMTSTSFINSLSQARFIQTGPRSAVNCISTQLNAPQQATYILTAPQRPTGTVTANPPQPRAKHTTVPNPAVNQRTTPPITSVVSSFRQSVTTALNPKPTVYKNPTIRSTTSTAVMGPPPPKAGTLQTTLRPTRPTATTVNIPRSPSPRVPFSAPRPIVPRYPTPSPMYSPINRTPSPSASAALPTIPGGVKMLRNRGPGNNSAGPAIASVEPGSNGMMNTSEKENAGKTFPSLVVMVKPCLQDKPTKQQAAQSRAELDANVKIILQHNPAKFTEWLMQKGLLRVDHKCASHPSVPYKLGMYSDGGTKQPFSGGYVWISDCCPGKQISVFQGSIFEASVYPTGTLVKLMYHWSCQTPASNVLQWVKVTSYYLKNFYTLLRSVCVAGLHENCKKLGGKGKYVEVGIITLGTTQTSASGQKQVKIEILGVFDPMTKCIRMKVINPQTVGIEDLSNERINQILWPLDLWVDKASVVLIDQSMDKTLLEEMGFRSVSQTQSGLPHKPDHPTNVNVMNYLKNIVPKMFQNTLCVLSKSLIQQFLDELSWRELWGSTPPNAFDMLTAHLVQITKADLGESLICRLNKISLNPFIEWCITSKPVQMSGIECLPESIRGGSSMMESASISMDGLSSFLMPTTYGRSKENTRPTRVPTQSSSAPSNSLGGLKRKADANQEMDKKFIQHLNTSPKIYTLQPYYYIKCPAVRISEGVFPNNLKCPLCSKLFVHNVDVVRHITTHVLNVGRTNTSQAICNYCLKETPAGSVHTLTAHYNQVHKMFDVPYCCRICNEKFGSDTNLILHMWKTHVECEAPYRCEVCDFRTSFHFEVVDHFHQEHSGADCVQCPICLKILSAKTFACLKMVVVHLQNHFIKKGKKCPDCVLVFPSEQEYRIHQIAENAHKNRNRDPFHRQKIIGPPIGMSEPPKITHNRNIPPPQKRARLSAAKGNNPDVQTLNMDFSVPLNLNEKYTHEPFPVRFDPAKTGTSKCWECGKDPLLTNHFTGKIKCTKCRFTTGCTVAILRHIKVHEPDVSVAQLEYGPQFCKPRLGKEVLTCGCGYKSRSTDLLASHLLDCDFKIAHLSNAPSDEVDDGPPVLQKQVEVDSPIQNP